MGKRNGFKEWFKEEMMAYLDWNVAVVDLATKHGGNNI